jgi:hypothetical protein
MRLFILTLTTYLFVSFSAAAQSQPSSTDQSSLKLALQQIDSDPGSRYIAAFYDLDGDGSSEAIVYLVSHNWCGTGGCNTLIFKREKNTWRKISDLTVTRPPIRVLKTKAKGWHDLGVWVQGGGIQPGYEAELMFNGKMYPRNPSVPPAIKSPKDAKGNILIRSIEDAVPLYDRK